MQNLLLSLMTALFFSSNWADASIVTRLEINQTGDKLLIVADVTSSYAQTLRLRKEAHVISYDEETKISVTDTATEFFIPAVRTSHITYELPVELTKVNYFIEEQNWYPRIETEDAQTFQVSTSAEPNFEFIHSAVGKSPAGVSLVFGAFKKYAGNSNKIFIYLQKSDDVLAAKLIAALEKYLILFEERIGPYPYQDFSVVESSDEIGYAFPRMTWIGSNLLRFPFILTTSLPHELLHSWWGNGVFVDHASGNWCEGLTTFGADYGILSEKEKLVYRRKILTEYADYVKNESEISLQQFTSRGEDKSLQAIGYGKSAMMFMMLEGLVGTKSFDQAIKSFYKTFKFQKATYRDFFNQVQLHSQVSAKTLDHFYTEWITKTGAVSWQTLTADLTPANGPSKAAVKVNMPMSTVERLRGLTVALNFQFSDGSVVKNELMAQTESIFQFEEDPISFSLDPELRIFRFLDEAERPSTFSKFFGSDTAEVIATASTKPVLNQVFSKIKMQTLESVEQIRYQQSGTVLIENYLGGNAKLDEVLRKSEVEFKSDIILIQGVETSLVNNAYFIAIPVEKKMIVFFSLNSSLPLNRWFERWARYGGQSYVVLAPTGALTQGVMTAEFVKKFRCESGHSIPKHVHK